MKQTRLDIGELPEAPVAATEAFYAAWPARISDALDTAEAVVLVLPPADHTHHDWRLGAVRSLARQHAPKRVNMTAGSVAEAVDGIADYLAAAPGVTGQYLPARENEAAAA
ncbi:Rossmann fold domain-containing protein [Qipengyuania atrilutea]|uniref:Short chain dehydrogenase-like proteobacteria domain-containing protein n=1 Tax=Qipengyuania atrilutea TaxID=2744473 RepID=A0A850H709_9SPHN|nr:hypothetical protein [Actirhodobacter atriluteus]NVD45593.1 hypothetical protein [Actirhodobacter atriluteus]